MAGRSIAAFVDGFLGGQELTRSVKERARRQKLEDEDRVLRLEDRDYNRRVSEEDRARRNAIQDENMAWTRQERDRARREDALLQEDRAVVASAYTDAEEAHNAPATPEESRSRGLPPVPQAGPTIDVAPEPETPPAAEPAPQPAPQPAPPQEPAEQPARPGRGLLSSLNPFGPAAAADIPMQPEYTAASEKPEPTPVKDAGNAAARAVKSTAQAVRTRLSMGEVEGLLQEVEAAPSPAHRNEALDRLMDRLGEMDPDQRKIVTNRLTGREDGQPQVAHRQAPAAPGEPGLTSTPAMPPVPAMEGTGPGPRQQAPNEDPMVTAQRLSNPSFQQPTLPPRQQAQAAPQAAPQRPTGPAQGDPMAEAIRLSTPGQRGLPVPSAARDPRIPSVNDAPTVPPRAEIPAEVPPQLPASVVPGPPRAAPVMDPRTGPTLPPRADSPGAFPGGPPRPQAAPAPQEAPVQAAVPSAAPEGAQAQTPAMAIAASTTPGEPDKATSRSLGLPDAPQVDKEGVDSFIKTYREVAVPKIVEHFLKRGDLEAADRFQTWADDGKTREGMESWVKATHAAAVGDERGFFRNYVDAYNAKGYYEDGYEIVESDSSFIRDDAGNITGAQITYRDQVTGETATQVYDGIEDIMRQGIYMLAPEAAFEATQEQLKAADAARADEVDHMRALELEAVKAATKANPTKDPEEQVKEAFKTLSETDLGFSRLPPAEQSARVVELLDAQAQAVQAVAKRSVSRTMLRD